jgi:hypothetical protein
MASPYNLLSGVNLDALSMPTRNMLNGIASRVNFGRPVDITSGYRSDTDNAKAGGAKGSQHTHGNAVDINITGWSDDQKRQFLDAAIDNGAKGIGIYASGNVLHIDTRANPMTWGADPNSPYAGHKPEQHPAWAQGPLSKLFASGGGTIAPPPAVATIRSTISDAAKQFGVNENLMMWMAKRESGFNPNATNPNSTAKGLFQFIDKTWADASARYGTKLGMPAGTPPTDPKWNAILAAALVKENQLVMGKMLGREASDGELYLGHFLGGQKAVNMIAAAENTPDQPAAALFPGEAAANYNIFYDKDGMPRTVAQVYKDMTNIGSVGGTEGGQPMPDKQQPDKKSDPFEGIQIAKAQAAPPAVQQLSGRPQVESDIEMVSRRVTGGRQSRGLMG